MMSTTMIFDLGEQGIDMNNREESKDKHILSMHMEVPCQEDETLAELKAAAFEVLLLNPGCEQSDWAEILIEQYATEIIDVYGANAPDVDSSLVDLWESPYNDPKSGLEYDFKTWALALATEESVQMYYDLTNKE